MHNKGKGHALNLGINESSKEYIGILDADLEYSPNDLKNLFEEIHENNIDIACGSRFIGDFKRENLYLRTYFANKFLSKLFSGLVFVISVKPDNARFLVPGVYDL